ncbi:MAG: 27-O-demethylrifamycin SV methyltransferase [Accumulibacter sp.]|uniref:class I SAM-dependent methyltransferase n=1 Tax=Accumulibacter sp. TaxID=2053492 RepID=UPI0011FE6D16|nr:methyltransferase domain-containing protein [Accumulibacter sp.]TLD47420.1 MAG: 27-O-demethylrifamycin SV methyltransferase [Accumulibacter sp.]
MTNDNLVTFLREPIEYFDGIPAFSLNDRYVDNYKKIAFDHVRAMSQTGQNPFIEEQLWLELEESTRTLIERHIADGSRVLDAGVGLGRLLGPLERLDRYGIDISIDYLKIARDRGFQVAFSKIEDMPYPDGVFDAVIACDVLEHVIDLHSCCVQLLRVLKPGGLFILRVPYLDDMSAYLDESLPYEFIHVRSFDVPSLRILFTKIHGMTYQEHAFSCPYLKDSLFKLRLFPLDSKVRQLASEADSPDHPLWTLRDVARLSHEAYRNWVYGLRDSNPSLLKELLPDLAEGLEVSMVFKKKDVVK